MVCLGVIFGCKKSHSIKGYVLSALAIIGILFCLRLLCYIIYRLLKDEHSRHSDQNSNHGVEMQHS